MKINMTCSECSKKSKGNGFFCSNYHSITGYFCSTCYNKIAHDSYGRPERPKDYLLMLLKHGVKQ